MEKIKDITRLWFVPGGRATRSELWQKTVINIVGLNIYAIVIDFVIRVSTSQPCNVVQTIVSLFCLIPFTTVGIKRLHDRNRSGWFFLLMFIPVIQLWPAIEIYFLKGTDGPNRFDKNTSNQESEPTRTTPADKDNL